MIDTNLNYNFPAGCPDPFDPGFDGNYFVYANAFSNLSKDPSTFSFDSLVKHIPMGYKTVIVCYRLAHYQNGQLNREWLFSETQPLTPDKYSGRYFLCSNKLQSNYIADWNRNVESAVIYRPETKDASLNSLAWENIDACKEYARKLSFDTKSDLLVSIIIDTINWH